jgi:glycosyltransferase involved in cell wall biosynthesis
MRLLFATAHPFPPEHVSEPGLTLRQLGQALSARGHSVMLMCGRSRLADYRSRSHAGVTTEGYDGVRLLRADDPVRTLPTLCAGFAPDTLVLADSGCEGLLAEAQSLGVPTALWLFGAEPHWFPDQMLDDAVLYLATSERLAGRARALFGIRAQVVPPFVAARTLSSQRAQDRVLFVNPVRAHGVETAFALARSMPDVPFTFVETWGLGEAWRDACFERALACGNIEWLPRSTDPAAALDRARLLLLPRADEPAGCQLVVEAHQAGVPVLASDRGDLREQVGDAGIVMPLDAPLNDWRDAMKRIIANWNVYRRRCNAAAAAHAEREASDAAVIERLTDALARHIRRGTEPRLRRVAG